ncbi:MAG: SPASM domain-containing protein [Desulfobacteraceae bacterium]|nr:SPASM domain-containing protein [Desulfobacteraceae bacterium]
MIESIEINLDQKHSPSRLSDHFLDPEPSKQKNKILSPSEIINLITQADDLGAKKIVLYNNSKNPYPDIPKITDHIIKLNITSEILSDQSIESPPKDPVSIECLKHKYSCFVTLDGNIFPCKGLPLPIGNIHKDTLSKILTDSEIIENLKNHTSMIKGPCRQCNKFLNCYGCRGRAFALTGDYLASDPLCPENQDKLDKITYLPISVESFIPQKQGMRVVSTLLNIEERAAKVESVFSDKSPFVKKDGSLEEVAYMEIMAQSAAVMNGFSKFDTGAPPPGGFLVGGQKINIYKKSYIKEKLIIDIYKTAKFGGFGILSAIVKRGNETIAEGEIKIFQNDGESNEI